jgi:hypothetical protein
MGKDIYTADDELDLSREWQHLAGDREGFRAWLQQERPHLLRSYDAEFLANAVERAREPVQGGR